MIVTLLSLIFIWFIAVLPFFSDVRREVVAVGFFGGTTWLLLWLFLQGTPFGILEAVALCIGASLTVLAARFAWPATFASKQRYVLSLSREHKSGL